MIGIPYESRFRDRIGFKCATPNCTPKNGYVGTFPCFWNCLELSPKLEDMEIPMAVDINVVNARPKYQISQPVKVCSQVFEVIIAKCD